MLVRAVFPRGIGCDALDTAGLPLLFGAVAVRDARSDRSPNMHVNHSDPTMVHNQEYEVKLKAMDAGTTVRRWCLGDRPAFQCLPVNRSTACPAHRSRPLSANPLMLRCVLSPATAS